MKYFSNTGFGSNTKNEGNRLLNKDGKFNTKKEGVGFWQRSDLFHVLINMSAFNFFMVLFLCYVLINVLFAELYILVGLEGLQGVTTENQFLQAFYFSTQTLTTVGYGGLHPTSNSLNLIASFEAFIGLISFAVATGLLYGRFSKPKPKVLFSEKALISPYNDITGLMIRAANPKSNQLINAQANVIFSQIEFDKEKGEIRRFYNLELELTKINLFATSWTIVHPITKDSPLYGLSNKDLENKNVEFMVSLNAFDETYNQDVHIRTSFKSNEVVVGAKFKPILGQTDEGQSYVKLDKLGDFDKV